MVSPVSDKKSTKAKGKKSEALRLSSAHEDYLRTIWKLNEWQDHPVTLTELTRALELSPSTVSEGVQRLVAKGLVRHARYGKISLTEEGHREAARMVRIHRLIETALVTIFGYSWDEVHDEAERLEHAVSDLFISRLDAALNHPTHDPHGERIPDEYGRLREDEQGLPLSSLSEGSSGIIARVFDSNPDALREFDELNLVPGAHLKIVRIRSSVGLLRLEVTPQQNGDAELPSETLDIPLSIAHLIAVTPIGKDSPEKDSLKEEN